MAELNKIQKEHPEELKNIFHQMQNDYKESNGNKFLPNVQFDSSSDGSVSKVRFENSRNPNTEAFISAHLDTDKTYEPDRIDGKQTPRIWNERQPVPLSADDVGARVAIGEKLKSPGTAVPDVEIDSNKWTLASGAQKEVLQKVQQSVVRISDGGANPTRDSFGSGFAAGEPGYILTDFHVVDGKSSIKVETNDGTEFIGTIVDKDLTHDVALVKLETPPDRPENADKMPEPLPLLKVDDLDQAKANNDFYLVGHPLGSDATITSPIRPTRIMDLQDFYRDPTGTPYNYLKTRFEDLKNHPLDLNFLTQWKREQIVGTGSVYHGDSGGPLIMTGKDAATGKLTLKGVVGLLEAANPANGLPGETANIPIKYGQALLEHWKKAQERK